MADTKVDVDDSELDVLRGYGRALSERRIGRDQRGGPYDALAQGKAVAVNEFVRTLCGPANRVRLRQR